MQARLLGWAKGREGSKGVRRQLFLFTLPEVAILGVIRV